MKKLPIIIIGIAMLTAGLALLPSSYFSPARNLFFQAARPFAIFGNLTVGKISSFFANLKHLSSLSKENEKLIRENLELQSRLAVLKEAQHESEILKKELGFASNKGELKLVPASIIGRSVSGFLKTVTIDRGRADGLKMGQAVISQGILVGVIKQIDENTSEVNLIYNYNSLVPVMLVDSRGTGLLRGGLEGLTVEDIPLNIPIKIGEQVVTSGLGGEMPAGILVGQTIEVISKPGEIFQKVTISSPIEIYYLEFVFVVQ